MFKRTMKDKMDFLKSIDYSTSLDNKPTIESLKKMSPTLHEYNAMTHTLYLAMRPDLDESEKLFHQEVIRKLMEKEKKLVDEALGKMNVAEL